MNTENDIILGIGIEYCNIQIKIIMTKRRERVQLAYIINGSDVMKNDWRVIQCNLKLYKIAQSF